MTGTMVAILLVGVVAVGGIGFVLYKQSSDAQAAAAAAAAQKATSSTSSGGGGLSGLVSTAESLGPSLLALI